MAQLRYEEIMETRGRGREIRSGAASRTRTRFVALRYHTPTGYTSPRRLTSLCGSAGRELRQVLGAGFDAGDEVEAAGEELEGHEPDDFGDLLVGVAVRAERVDLGVGDLAGRDDDLLAVGDDCRDLGVGGRALPSELDVGVRESELSGGAGVRHEAVVAAQPLVDREVDALDDAAVQVRALHRPIEVEVPTQQRRRVGH